MLIRSSAGPYLPQCMVQGSASVAAGDERLQRMQQLEMALAARIAGH